MKSLSVCRSIWTAPSSRLLRARKFANRIHGRFGVTVTLHDERLSTVEARSGLFEQGGYRALNKGKVDSASAVVILESYFEQGY